MALFFLNTMLSVTGGSNSCNEETTVTPGVNKNDFLDCLVLRLTGVTRYFFSVSVLMVALLKKSQGYLRTFKIRWCVYVLCARSWTANWIMLDLKAFLASSNIRWRLGSSANEGWFMSKTLNFSNNCSNNCSTAVSWKKNSGQGQAFYKVST